MNEQQFKKLWTICESIEAQDPILAEGLKDALSSVGKHLMTPVNDLITGQHKFKTTTINNLAQAMEQIAMNPMTLKRVNPKLIMQRPDVLGYALEQDKTGNLGDWVRRSVHNESGGDKNFAKALNFALNKIPKNLANKAYELTFREQDRLRNEAYMSRSKARAMEQDWATK